MSLTPSSPSQRFALAALLLFALAGCSGDKKPEPETQPVAAVVNGVEITQREVDLVYQTSEAPDTPPDLARAQRRAILAKLVRTELLAQQAIAEKLDASPDFLVETRLARRQALAHELERKTLPAVKEPDATQARDFMALNPALFAGRRQLVLEELAVKTHDEGLFKALEAAIQKGATMDRLEQLVLEARASARRSIISHTTDQLPREVLAGLKSAKPDLPVIVRNGATRGLVLLVRASVPAPMLGEAATQMMKNAAHAQARQEALQQRVLEATEAAEIAYYGEFAPGAKAADATNATNASNVAEVALPTTAAKPTGWQRVRPFALFAISALAAASAVLVMFAFLRYWYGGPWLPELLIPAAAAPDDPNVPEDWSDEFDEGEAGQGIGLVRRLLLGVSVLVCAGLLGALLFVVFYKLPWWALAAALAGGVFLGLRARRWFAYSRLRAWSSKGRGWRVVLFATPLLGLSALGIWL